MRTGRSLTVCCSLLPGLLCLVQGGLLPGGVGSGGCAWSGGCLLPGWGCAWIGGVCLLRSGAWSGGCLCSRGGGVCSWGVPGPGGSAPRGVPGPGGVCSRGVSTLGGGYPSMHWGRHPFPPVDRHMLMKILPWPNFVAAGKNVIQA